MKVWTLALLAVPFALALPASQSSSKCNKASSTSSSAYPLISLYSPYNSTYKNWNSTRSANRTTTGKPARYSQSSSTAFPTDVFPHGSIPTLQPVIPAYHDADSLHCLDAQEPGPGTPLHYAQESKPGSYGAGTFAIVTPNFNIPSVVLDYANAAQQVVMARGGDLVITFSDLQAFLRSSDSWKSLSEIAFVTFTEGCGDYTDGERCYFLANQLVFDQSTLSVRAVGKASNVRDLTDTIHVSWGSYNDHDVSAAASGSSGGNNNNAPASTGGRPYPYPSNTVSASAPYPTLSPNNSTINMRNSTGDCAAPVDNKYGLPTSCTGPHFDDNLDSGLGYKASKDFSWSDWVDMMTLEDPYAEPMVISKDSLGARGLNRRSLSGLFHKIVNAIAPKIKSLTQALGNKISELVHAPTMNDIIKGAVVAETVIGNILTGKPNEFDIEFAKIQVPPNKNDSVCLKDTTKCDLISKDAKSVQTPWDDDGILIKSFGSAPPESELSKGRTTRTKANGQFLNVYCVKCGVSGSAKVSGSITIKGTSVVEGNLDVGINMNIGLGVGIYAQLVRSETFGVNLFNVPISPFNIGVLTVGPYVSIDAKTDITINATGTALVRADATFSNAKFTYDFGTRQGKQVGFKPVFKPLFQTEGEIDLTADFGVPVGLKVGISTVKGCSHCEGSIGIENYPYIKATASAALEAQITVTKKSDITGGFNTLNGCKGITAALSIGNDVTLTFDGFGFVTGQYDVYKAAEYQIKSWCLDKPPNFTKRSISPHEYNVHHYPRDGLNGTSLTNTTSNSNNTDIVDLTHYVVSDADVSPWQGSDIPNHAYNLEGENEDYWFTTVAYATANGPNKDYVLVSCSDGNLYMMKNEDINNLDWHTACSAIWRGYDGTILTDSNQALMYYYKNTMDKTSVSRVRVAHPQSVPDTAAMVLLAPFHFDETNPTASVLAAYDDSQNVLFPVVCSYSDSSASKIYLVRGDIASGISTLKSPDLKYTVTNGDVSDCKYLPLNWGTDTQATQPEWAVDNGDECLSKPEQFKAEIEVNASAYSDGKLIENVEQVSDDTFFDVFTQPMFDKSEYFTN